MGRVYRVDDIKLQQEVALKLIKPDVSSDKKTIERFRNELKTARNIRHKNVCGMYDLGEEGGTHYITMEYIRGEDLKSLIRKIGQLSAGQVITIAKQVCDGLVEAHRLGIVHRDLKPQNVMIDTEGNARIMDFGIARSLEAKGITGAGIMIGTPEYMSPEQVEGKEVDPRTDVYSLGVVLYEMATGRVPFEGDTAFVIGMKHKSETPKDPREFNSQIPKELSQVILRCLEKDKARRYQSAAEVRSELAKIEEGIPTTERVIPERRPLTSRQITVQFSLKKLLVPGLALAAVVIIGLVLWRVLPKRRTVPFSPSDKPSLAILYFENNTGEDELDHWRKGLAELLITDLSQSKYFRVLSGDTIYDILRETDLLEAKSYSSTDLDRIASRGGAKYILRGGYTKAADTFRININLQDVQKRESIGSETVTGQGAGSIYGLVDELTRRIKGNFQLSDRISDRERYQIQGQFYRQSEGTYDKAIEALDQLIELYPDDNIGNNNLALIYFAIEGWDKAIEHNRVCLAHQGRSGNDTNLSGLFCRHKGPGGGEQRTREGPHLVARIGQSRQAEVQSAMARHFICQDGVDRKSEAGCKRAQSDNRKRDEQEGHEILLPAGGNHRARKQELCDSDRTFEQGDFSAAISNGDH